MNNIQSDEKKDKKIRTLAIFLSICLTLVIFCLVIFGVFTLIYMIGSIV